MKGLEQSQEEEEEESLLHGGRSLSETCNSNCAYETPYATCDGATSVPVIHSANMVNYATEYYCCLSCLNRAFLPINNCNTASPDFGTQIGCERASACLQNATACSILNMDSYISNPTSLTPFSSFAFHPIFALYMGYNTLDATILQDRPNFFYGLINVRRK